MEINAGGAVTTGDVIEAGGDVTVIKGYDRESQIKEAIENRDEKKLGEELFTYFEKYGPGASAFTGLAQMIIGLMK